jgi:hypothetical protein
MYDLGRFERSGEGHPAENGAHVTNVSFVKGMNVSNPLNKVMIPVAISANHEPHGWKGALYGSVSRDMLFALRARMNALAKTLINERFKCY